MNLCNSKAVSGVIAGLLFSPMIMALGQIPNSPRRSSTSNGATLQTSRGATPTLHKILVDQWIHSTDNARAALRAGDYLSAEDYAQQAIDTHLDVVFGQELMVEALHGQSKDMEAMPFYQSLFSEGMTEPQYELPYALLLLKTGQWAQAVTVYNRTLPFLWNGDLLRAQNNFSPAVQRTKDLETAIHIALGIHYVGSVGWAARLQNDEGLLNFRQAIALAPNNALAYYQYGLGLARYQYDLGPARTSHKASVQAQAQAAFRKAAALGDGDIKAAALKELPGAMQPR